MKKKVKKPAKQTEPRRMYLGFMRTEREIASLESLRAEAVRQHNDWLTNRKPCWVKA